MIYEKKMMMRLELFFNCTLFQIKQIVIKK